MNYENRLNDQRRMWKFLLFGILTLGIYQLVFLYKMNNDINTACNPVLLILLLAHQYRDCLPVLLEVPLL